jgi:FixJ family two-component response regulator
MMQGGTLVCIVDDDLSVRRSLARLIGACGMATRSFSSADEYLDAYAGLDVGCLVLDIHLGAVSGLDLLGELRSRGVQTPVVVITAFDEPSLEKRARREGAIAWRSGSTHRVR